MSLTNAVSTLTLLGLFGFAPLAQAATTTYNVSPADLASGKPQFSAPHGTGSNPFAYDWDSAAPQIGPGAPTGFGGSSFYADVAESGITQADRYRTVRIATTDLFDDPVTIGDIAKISYQTNKSVGQSNWDWRLTIYTTPGDKAVDPNDAATGAGDSAGWYRSRIQSFPQESSNLNAPANTLNTWTTDDNAANQMIFFTNRVGLTTHDIEFNELTAGIVHRSSDWDFSGEGIMMIDITLGANNGGFDIASSLDAIRIELTNGDIAIINAVPEPTGIAMASLGLIFLGRRAIVRHSRR